MKLKKLLAILIVFAVAVSTCALNVLAAADVDFTLHPVTEGVSEFAPGNEVKLEVFVTTQTSNGYDSFTLEIEYNADVLVYSDTAFDEDGCKGSASNGVLTLSYTNPEGKNSNLGDKDVIIVRFTVLEGAPGGETGFKATVKTCTGKNTTGATTNRTYAKINERFITIADISSDQGTVVTDSDYGDIITNLTGEEEDEVTSTVTVIEKKGGMPVFWAIVLILLAFAGGLVVGFKICENRGGGGIRRRYDDIEDEDDEELPTFTKKKQPLRKPSLEEDDDSDFDTSYFGRASEVSIGSDFFDKYNDDQRSFEEEEPETEIPSVFSEVDEDDRGFPGTFFPRNYAGRKDVQDDDGFGSFDFDAAETNAKADAAFNFNFSDDDFGGDDDDFGGDDFGDDMDMILRRR